MAAGAVAKMSSLRYALIYLPFVGLGLLSVDENIPSSLLFRYLNLSDPFIFGSLVTITFVGASINHQLNLAIYGPEGPRRNPKHWATAKYHIVASYFIKNPKPVPRDLDELFDRVVNVASQLEGNWTAYLYLLFRAVFISVPAFTYTLVEYSLLLGLAIRFFTTDITSIEFVVLFGLSIKKVQPVIAGRFQSPIAEDAGRWVMVPESRRAEILYKKGELQPRYAPEGLSLFDFLPDSELESSEDSENEEDVIQSVFVPLPEDGEKDEIAQSGDADEESDI